MNPPNRTQIPLLWAAVALFLLALPARSLAAWSGQGCAPPADLEAVIDDAFALGPAAFPERGSGAPGYSAAVFHDDCGLFAHAVGKRRIENGLPMLASTRQHIGSLTKPVTAALTLILADRGDLGPDGIETTVDRFFTRRERRRLKKGAGPNAPLCPARILGFDRELEEFASVRAKCPNFSKITVRHLLNGNHGLWDFVNEIDRDANGIADAVDYLLTELLDAFGVEHRRLGNPVVDPFGILETTGVLVNKKATIGGTRIRDFEASFGNTGYQLLGLVLEKVTGRSYDALVREHIVKPLKLTKMSVVTKPPKNRNGKLATPYSITTGADSDSLPGGTELDESLGGIYPLADVNGHPAVDSYSFNAFPFANSGGGAGALSAAPKAYVRFFHALVRGGLLSPSAQQQLDGAYLNIGGTGVRHGFGLFSQPSLGDGQVITKSGRIVGGACIAIHSVEASGGNGATVVVCRNSIDLFLSPLAGDPPSAEPVEDIALDLVRAALP